MFDLLLDYLSFMKTKIKFTDLYASILEAYYDCKKGKRHTYNCIEFETNAMRKCFALAIVIYYGTYEIG